MGALAVALAGCGSSASTTPAAAAGGLPPTITLQAVQDLTGPAGYAGTYVQRGAQVAVKEINDTGFLGSTKIDLAYADTRSDRQQAGILATKAAATDTPVLLGTTASTSGQVISPIVERAKLPTIYAISTADGVNIGRYTYRASVPAATMVVAQAEALKKYSPKSMSIIYDSDADGTVLLGTKAMPALAEKLGIPVKASKTTVSTTADYTAVVSSVLQDKPDVVGIGLVTAAGGTALIQQLRLQGFTGPIAATSVLDSVSGKLGAGAGDVYWATAFNKNRATEATRNFDKVFAQYCATCADGPTEYDASGYDAVWTAVRAIKEANSVDREAVTAGLEKVAATGFAGSSDGLKYVNRDFQIASPAVVWLKAGTPTLTN
ncbi:ABC transporter substrate-binding protein [Pseudonocardia ailaonensis]|uniref:ABC transporter substrate-binding protein n=2 Tax=Pseudonocardia ailaonensis TaxID=367279 RepID=A0ABN2NJY8_9PSEU